MSEEDEFWDWDRYTSECTKVQAKLSDTPADQLSSELLLKLIGHFPAAQRNGAYTLLAAGFQAHRLQAQVLQIRADEDMRKAKAEQTREVRDHQRELRTFYGGALCLAIDLLCCVLAAHKDASTLLLLRILAGLGVALMIAYLPSLFSIGGSVDTSRAKFAFKATGGIAALVMIYFFDPGWFGSLFHVSR